MCITGIWLIVLCQADGSRRREHDIAQGNKLRQPANARCVCLPRQYPPMHSTTHIIYQLNGQATCTVQETSIHSCVTRSMQHGASHCAGTPTDACHNHEHIRMAISLREHHQEACLEDLTTAPIPSKDMVQMAATFPNLGSGCLRAVHETF